MTSTTSGRPREPRWIRPARAPATVPPPLDGIWAPDDSRVDWVERFPLPFGAAPEDVAVDSTGRLVVGGDDGSIWRWSAAARAPQLVVNTGGRPLGVEVDRVTAAWWSATRSADSCGSPTTATSAN